MIVHNHQQAHHRGQPAQPVRIVAGNPIAECRAREARLVAAVLAMVCALAAGCAILPALDNLVTTAVVALAAVAVFVAVLRWVARRVRWWAEDRADARTAATWRAQHTQHTQQAGQDDAVWAGVA